MSNENKLEKCKVCDIEPKFDYWETINYVVIECPKCKFGVGVKDRYGDSRITATAVWNHYWTSVYDMHRSRNE